MTSQWIGGTAAIALAIRVQGGTRTIQALSDLPAAVSGVITLDADTTYLIMGALDLAGARLECAGITTIIGLGQETCSITSTGLASGALITSTDSLTIRALTLVAASGVTAVDVTGDGADTALDWSFVNFTGPGRAIRIEGVNNALMDTMGFLAGGGLLMEGTINTLAITESIFVVGDGLVGLEVDSAASINRRMRLNSCAVVTLAAGATGISVAAASIALAEGMILDFVNFSGGGTYVDGIAYTDNEARWIECRGITNTARVGELYWVGNASATTIASAGTYVLANGTATAGAYNQRFSVTTTAGAHRLTYTGALTQTFVVQVTVTCTTGNNQEIGLRAYLNGSPLSANVSRSTASGSGKAEGIAYQAIVELSEDDYLEVWVTNLTAANNVTVTDLTMQARAI